MQRRAFLLTGLAAGLSTTANAADAVNEGFAGLSSTGVIQLERQTAVIRGDKRGAMGFGGELVFYELTSPASQVRFKAGATPSFVVNGPADADPRTRYGLFRLTVVRDKRRLSTGRSLPQGIATMDIQSRFMVPFTASRYSADFFKLDPVEPLTPGEYALAIASTLGNKIYAQGGKPGRPQGVFAFGVD